MKERHKDSHKGDNGKVLVIGGSRLYTGAQALCSLAVLRSGADLVYTASPERAADIVASFSPDLITIKLKGTHFKKEHIGEIKSFLEKVNSIVIGPGLNNDPETKIAVSELVKICEKPIVIDADALKIVGDNPEILKDKKAVLTPHRHEFEIISGKKANKENVREFTAKLSAEHSVVTLLKAPNDIISNGMKVKVNKIGNPGMTVGGTGDVLSGLVAGFISQGNSLLDSAYNGAKINGEAGDLCREEMGYGFTASDLLVKIPALI
ncbi:MAG: NAD(P)H-hydrate dehydratase [Candidatus Undinarchaeales archaeon]